MGKKELKWSNYKKVPVLVVDGEQMNDSTGTLYTEMAALSSCSLCRVKSLTLQLTCDHVLWQWFEEREFDVKFTCYHSRITVGLRTRCSGLMNLVGFENCSQDFMYVGVAILKAAAVVLCFLLRILLW